MPSILAYNNNTVDFQIFYFNYLLGKLNYQVNQLTILTIVTTSLLALLLILSISLLLVCLWIQWKKYESCRTQSTLFKANAAREVLLGSA